ncbi:ribokinase [Nitriliruptor alkaliphilus]|uniref:ribokinase n=1 Tax=Nitriliruptor alkaliphilus TaxID=427918 RepID=UPI0006960305|nr:ribokinase [Nitriliruptor alkaliphilus]
MTDDPARYDVAVVGSANVDLVVPVEALPRPGQTVLGGDHLRAPGGKGANQAVAAGRLGRRVAMIGRVGDDDPGRLLLDSLRAAGVDTANVRTTPDAPSGIALITVDAAGENTIAVSPGANARVTVGDVQTAGTFLRHAAVTLVQLEVPLDAVAAAVAEAGGTVVLNPAPAVALPATTLANVDVLTPNRSELGVLAGTATPRTIDEAVTAAERLPRGMAVVVTLGADGALVLDGDTIEHLPACAVTAVDATGAGDAFCGALADGLSRDLTLVEAARWAVRVAGAATTRWGAQPAMPTPEEVEALTDRVLGGSDAGGTSRSV